MEGKRNKHRRRKKRKPRLIIQEEVTWTCRSIIHGKERRLPTTGILERII
jgi:hypothetical protein